jgi:phytase-like protein/caspase domain-containing protein
VTAAPEGDRPVGRIDPARSACVLIGVDAYTVLDPLRGVRNNLTELRDVLTDEAVWGLTPDRLRVVSNPRSAAELIRPVREMAERAEDTLIVYYAGHGLRDPDHDKVLFLTLPESERRAPYTAVRYSDVLGVIENYGSPRRRVVILDCCFSGMAVGEMSAVDLVTDLVADLIEVSGGDVQGLYVMTSAAADRKALAPERDTCTAFTGMLVKVLREGIEDKRKWRLSLDDLFGRVKELLRERKWPEPQKKGENEVGELDFVHNRALAAPPPTRTPPAGGWLGRVMAAVAAVLAFVAGLAVPYDPTGHGNAAGSRSTVPPGGPCPSSDGARNATLLSATDRFDKKMFQTERIVGFSALALTGPAQALALRDDSNNGGARIFQLALGPAERLWSPDTKVTNVTTLTDGNGQEYKSDRFDGEGLVVEKDARGRPSTILVSSEIGPVIRRFDIATGHEQGPPLKIPPNLETTPEGSAQRGRTIEALGATPDGHYLFAGWEAPLSGDGDKAGRNLLRIQRYVGAPGRAYTPDRQYAYLTGFGLNLADLVVVSETRLITLERQFVEGVGNAVRVYDVDLTGAKNVANDPSLRGAGGGAFVKSDLLFDLGKCPPGSPGQVRSEDDQSNPLLTNVEGMALGDPRPSGPDKGARLLYLVSDDNDNTQQITRLYALRVRLPQRP